MYRDLVYRPSEDSYGTRDLVFRPGVDATYAETLPYRMSPGPGSGGGIVESRPTDPGISETPRTAETPDLSGLVRGAEEADRKARLFLELFMGSMGDGAKEALLAQQFPMSQEDFRDRVERRIDARGPSMEERLRRLGASSLRDAINRGILPAPPRLPGV